ncbi:hypothetical protein Tco_0152664 [Tanacetum coccineum]
MDVRRIEEEVHLDFLSDAHSRTGPAESEIFVFCAEIFSLAWQIFSLRGDNCGTEGTEPPQINLNLNVVERIAMHICEQNVVKSYRKRNELDYRLFACGIYVHLRSRLVSDSTMRDVEWVPIEEEHLEEPKEGWMLGESKKVPHPISSRYAQSKDLVPAEFEASSSFLSFGINRMCIYVSFDGAFCFELNEICYVSRKRELVVKYKAEKVCHEEMVKMPLVDLKVLETKREGDCLYDATTRDSCEERHDSRYGRRRDGFALKDDGWSYLGVVIARPSTTWEREDVVVDAWSRKEGVKPRRV